MNPGKGIVAGFIATVALSVLMVGRAAVPWFPAFGLIDLIHGLTGGPAVLGWLGHFAIGSLLWGVLFALVYRWMPGRRGLFRGIVFGVCAWLAMMLFFLPIAGGGFFAVAFGWPVVGFTATIHLIYGAILGVSYASLTAQR